MAPLSLKIILDEGAVTRTILFDSNTRVQDARDLVKQKLPAGDDGKDYGLFLTSADDSQSGVWLEGSKCLDYYMLRDGDALHYLCRLRMLRVRMLDGTVKTLQVDESKNVGELLLPICSKVGVSNHEEYGLCREEVDGEEGAKDSKPVGTLTLRRATQPRDKDAKMEQLSKKLKTDDNVEWLDQHKTLRELRLRTADTLLLKRRLYYSDRNVDSRDPVQLNLLYAQARDAVLAGRHPVTEQQATDCKWKWAHLRDVNRRSVKKALISPHNKRFKFKKEMAFMLPMYELPFTPKLEPDDDNDEPITNDNDELDGNHSEELFTNDNGELDTSDNEELSIANNPEIDTVDNDKFQSSESEEPENKPLVKKPVKRKTTCNNVQPEAMITDTVFQSPFDPADPVDSFLLNIGSTLKTFDRYHLNKVKSKIFAAVQEHELSQIVKLKRQKREKELDGEEVSW